MVNREAIGIITGIDKPDANVERVRRWLQLAGCKKVFPVSSITGEGIAELAKFLNEPSGRIRPQVKKKPTVVEAKAKTGDLETYLL
jgi:ethanolamine utilization protein EutP